jgi:hypothetical protein
VAESHRYSGILAAALRAQPGIPAVFRLQVFASQKLRKSIHAGLPAGDEVLRQGKKVTPYSIILFHIHFPFDKFFSFIYNIIIRCFGG